MRPEQKIIMSCRQTGERAERLLEWLDQSRLTLKAQDRALRTEVHGLANELLALVEAVEQPPTAGLIGAWGSARAELVGALMVDAPAAAADDETQLTLARDRVMALLPRDADGGTAARVRLVATERAEGPFRFPIRLGLLSQLDLVKILASAYLLHVPPRRQRLPDPSAVAANLTTKAQEIVQQSFSGMSRRDVDGLRDYLHGTAPESRALRELDAGGYWDLLGGLIPHLPDALRRRAFALLWGEDPALTDLFNRLADALELLGFTGEIFTAIDGLLGRDPVTGWMVRHPDSLLAANTMLSCHDLPERTIRVSSRHGRAVEVERFALAALLDEVRLPIDPAQLPLLETADFLVLPAARPVMLWPAAAAPGLPARSRPGRDRLSPRDALEIFAAQKAAYQTDQAVRRHTLTSLLVAADFADHAGTAELDVTTTGQIANWIEITQGDTPHARERRRTGIAILAAEGEAAAAIADPVLAGSDGDTRFAATIEAVLDGNKDWAAEWTPNRPFRNVFTWRPPRAVQLPVPVAGQPGSADILRFARLKDAGAAAGAVPELGAAYDLVNLQHAMSQATTVTIHGQQISARLADVRRALAARFLRLHSSNDPSTMVEWRRQICHVTRNRLQQAAQHGGFGRLQRALMFTEGEAHAVLARIKIDDLRHRTAPAPDLRVIEPDRIVQTCLEAWIAGMRQSSRAPELMRAVRVPGSIVAHMVDELVIGALRIGLQEKLSEAVRRIQLSAVRAVDCENSVAALMERGINAYVETLDPGARTFRSSVHRDPRFGLASPVASPAGSPAAAAAGRARAAADRAPGGIQDRTLVGTRKPGPTVAAAIADDWAETFADLIEANILGASLLGGAGHLNRELGEVLAAISAGPFEGFQ